jgi:predicted dehydrogenase
MAHVQCDRSPSAVRIAVVGAGDIGHRHMAAIKADPACELAAIVETAAVGEAVARQYGAPLFRSLDAMLDSVIPDGVVVATPNSTHVPIAEQCLKAGIPLLVEKPVSDTVESAYELAGMSESCGVPVLVGHHRRHNSIIQEARRVVADGTLGDITAVNAIFLVRKPDDYFEVPWRRERGGGPILINLIHDIDSLRHVVGEIVSVQGTRSNSRRHHAVEDTAAVIVTFANGAVGTVIVSDATPSPCSWELTAGEKSSYVYPCTGQDCYLIAGSRASLSVPTLRVWRHEGVQSWRSPMSVAPLRVESVDAHERQMHHFADVIRGAAEPIINARDGARTLEVTLAVIEASTRRTVIDLPVGCRAGGPGR